MNIQEIMNAAQPPVVYSREGKDCYYDPYRQKFAEATPEEMIRQKTAGLLENVFGVPRDMLWLEVPMSYYINGSRGRADIIVHGIEDAIQELYPLAVVECKNENVILTDQTVDQAIRYCDTIGGRYVIVTNGIQLKAFVYDEASDTYMALNRMPSYEEMLGDDYELAAWEDETFVRFDMEELRDQQLIQQYNDEGEWIFGQISEPWLRSFAVNLYQCFLDTDHMLPPYKCSTFQLIQDIGLREMDYSNAGGGHFHGTYRSFLVKDRFGEIQLVSMSVFGTDTDFRGENRTSYTLLNVAADTLKNSHNALQYNLDKYAFRAGDQIRFSHNGQIGNHKKSDVLAHVSSHGIHLKADSKGILIGTLPADRLLYLDDKDVSRFIYSLVEYALLREEVRYD